MGNGAWGMGNGAWGMGHWALGIGHGSTVNSQQSTVNSQQLTVNSQQLTVNSQQLTVNSQQSTVNCLLIVLIHELFDEIRVNFAAEKFRAIEDFLVETEGSGNAGNRAFPQCPFHPANG